MLRVKQKQTPAALYREPYNMFNRIPCSITDGEQYDECFGRDEIKWCECCSVEVPHDNNLCPDCALYLKLPEAKQ